MGKGKKALAFAVGLGGGYLDAKEDERKKKLQDEDRQMVRDTHELKMRTAKRAEDDVIALRNAAAPAAVSLANDVPMDDDGNPMPAVPQHRVETPSGVQRFETREQADAAAASHNDPVALSQRISSTLTAQGRPGEAMDYQAKAAKFADEKWERDLRDAMGRGHQGIADFLTSTQAGPLKGKRFAAVPGADGKTVTYHVLNEDGTSTPTPYTLPNDQNGVIQAGYQLSKISPETRYKHMVEEDRKAAAAASKERELSLRERMIDEVKIPQAEATIALRGAQAAAAEARAARGGSGGDDKTSKEERLRWTAAMDKASGQLKEARKTLTRFETDTVFMSQANKPNSPQAKQLADLRAELDEHRGDYKLYQDLLAGSQGARAREDRDAKGGKPGAPAKPAASASSMPAPATKAEYDKLPKGTRYRHPDGTVKVKP